MYRPKETLWDHLDEFVDKTVRFIEKENDFPDVVHGHYADGNYIAGQVSEIFGMPFIATSHSLGRNKKNILLQEGLSPEKLNEKFNINRRIAAEENMIAAIVVPRARCRMRSGGKCWAEKIKVSTGTRIKPPPIPSSPAKKPTTAPSSR